MNKRLRNHAVLGACTLVSLGVSVALGPSASAADRLSIVSAYLCLGLLGGALLIGPVNVLRKGVPLVNAYARRDVGIWAALSGLIHFYLANVLAMNYEYLEVFVDSAEQPPSPELRSSLYTWGTILGYFAALSFIVLLALSNDWMVRRLGIKWWKRIQRASYVCFLATCIHAFAFQVLESRAVPWVIVIASVVVLVLIGQGYGATRIKKS